MGGFVHEFDQKHSEYNDAKHSSNHQGELKNPYSIVWNWKSYFYLWNYHEQNQSPGDCDPDCLFLTGNESFLLSRDWIQPEKPEVIKCDNIFLWIIPFWFNVGLKFWTDLLFVDVFGKVPFPFQNRLPSLPQLQKGGGYVINKGKCK